MCPCSPLSVLDRVLLRKKVSHRKMKVKSLSRVQLFATPWTVACQASLSMAFSRQEYWSGLPFPIPGDLQNPGIKPTSPALTGRSFHCTTSYPLKSSTPITNSLLSPCIYRLIFKLFIFFIYFQIDDTLFTFKLFVYGAGSPLLLGPSLQLRTGAPLELRCVGLSLRWCLLLL